MRLSLSVVLPALLSSLASGSIQPRIPEDVFASYHQLTQSFESAIPSPTLFKEVVDEVRHFASFEDVHNPGQMKYGKKSTNWLQMFDEDGNDVTAPPRNYIEHVVRSLYDLARPEDFYGQDYNLKHYGELIRYTKKDILGAEWWIQKRSGKESIGFHYDKDEAYASDYMRMRYPILSTITYLTNFGAPTLILNQTSLDGSIEFPEVPHEGFLSFPKASRHVIFRGDLNHGVSSSQSLDKKSDERVTLLVNWWTTKPMEPNCHIITDANAKKLKLYYPDKVQATLKSKAVKDSALPSRDTELGRDVIPFMQVDGNPKDFTRHFDRFPPNDAFHFDMPPNKELSGQTLYGVRWGNDNIFAQVGMLDLMNQNQIGALFRAFEPKVILFVNSESDLVPLDKWFQPLAKGRSAEFKFYTATADKTKDAWGKFGITAKDLPTAVIHDTKADKIMTLKMLGEPTGAVSEKQVKSLMRAFMKEKERKENDDL